jgi:hypothetical protein
MSPPPPLHYSSRVTTTQSNLKKRTQNDTQLPYDSFLLPGKEEEVEDRDTVQGVSDPIEKSSSPLMDYGAASNSDDESLSWDSGFKNLDDYYNQICVLETEMTLQLLPSQMFACLKQSSSSSSSSQAYSYHIARGGGILRPTPQSSIAQNYAYSIDPFFKEPHSSPSPSCSPPSPRTFNPPSSRQSQKIPLYRQNMEEVLFKLDEDQFIELPERNVVTKTHQKIAKESPDERERVKLQVVVEPKENNSSENSEKETKGRRPKRRKILWKRMNPTLFQEIFQWETNQPKVKQSQIEKKFNVNRSTYYRWKKKYLAQ